MSPRRRKTLNPKARDFPTRFALHLRAMLDRRKLTTTAFLAALNKSALDVSDSTVKKWVAGERLPLAQDFEAIGRVLKLRDYRQSLPPPA